MKRTFKEYKAAARSALRGNYGRILAGVLIASFAPTVLIRIITSFLRTDYLPVALAVFLLELIFSIIVIKPLGVGISRMFIQNAKGRTDMNDLLYPFRSNHTNIVKVCFIRDLKLFLWFLIPFLIGYVVFVGIVAVFIAKNGISDEVSQSLNNIYNAILQGKSINTALVSQPLFADVAVFVPLVMLVCCIPALIMSIRYTVIDFILADNADITSKEAFRLTKEMMAGNTPRLFRLGLSFIGWILLLCVFLMLCTLFLGEIGTYTGIIGIYIIYPYIRATITQFYFDVSGQNKDFSYGSD